MIRADAEDGFKKTNIYKNFEGLGEKIIKEDITCNSGFLEDFGVGDPLDPPPNVTIKYQHGN